MRVRIYSWFKSGNIGDILISEQIKRMFESSFECTFCDISNGEAVQKTELVLNSCDSTFLKMRVLNLAFVRETIDFVYSFRKRNTSPFKSLAKDCNLAIFAGGNSLMELNKHFPGNSRVIYNRVKELKRQNIPVAFCFSGVGPFCCKKGKRYIKNTLQLADFVSVRDDKSKELCESIGAKNIELWRDPVLAYTPKITDVKPKHIAVNVFFGTDKRLESKTFNAYVQSVKMLKQLFPHFDIVLFSSETADYKQVESVYKCFMKDCRIKALNVTSPDELFCLYEKSALVIGARMHSLITAVISDKPIVAVSWQEKVTSFINFIGCEQFLISQKEFCDNPERLAFLAGKSIDDYSKLKIEIHKLLNSVKFDLDHSLKSFAQKMEEKYGL